MQEATLTSFVQLQELLLMYSLRVNPQVLLQWEKFLHTTIRQLTSKKLRLLVELRRKAKVNPEYSHTHSSTTN